MSIVLVGLSHKTAPVELRERLAFCEPRLPEALNQLVDHSSIDEGLIVSTCNRVELLAFSPPGSQEGFGRLTGFLSNFHNLPAAHIEPHIYRHADLDAIKHLFRVASSLDSLVIGESQILSQVKTAYQHAVQAGTVGRVLSQTMQRALAVAKRVRNETGISQHPVSVSSVAVELAKKVFGDLSNSSVLLLGAGEMGELAARRLIEAGTTHLIVTNRTAERAEEIARVFGGGAVSFEAFYDVLPSADIVICSTGSSDYVVNPDETKRALRSRRKGPVLFIDISVPRNIDPGVADLDNCFLFDIDDLESVVEANLNERGREAHSAEAIIESEAEHFIGFLGSLDLGSNIAEIKKLILEIASGEFKRSKKHMGPLTPEQEAAIQNVLIPGLVNKLSHPVIVHLRTAAHNGVHHKVIEELRKIVRLD